MTATYTCLSSNSRGRRYPNYVMPPRQCERVGCTLQATVVAEVDHGNWYLCASCGTAAGVVIIVRLDASPEG